MATRQDSGSSILDEISTGLKLLALILFTLIIMGIFVDRWWNSSDHTHWNLKRTVRRLRNTLVEERFIPSLIIGVSRSGLNIAARLSPEFGGQPNIPVVYLWPRPTFEDKLNNITLVEEYFKQNSGDPNLLIVDDICKSGRTLSDAKRYATEGLDTRFKIKTAVISFYVEYADPITPDFYVNRP